MPSDRPPNRDRSPFARLLGAADEGFFRLESGLNLIAALVILAVMFIGVFQVFGRKLINLPVPGYVDVIEFVMTVFAFISIAYTQRLGGPRADGDHSQAVPGPDPLARGVPRNADRHRHRRDPRVVRVRALSSCLDHRRQHDRHRDSPLALQAPGSGRIRGPAGAALHSSSSDSCGSRWIPTRSRSGSRSSRPWTSRPSTRSRPVWPEKRMLRSHRTAIGPRTGRAADGRAHHRPSS